jgi:hypothetical protein
MVSSSRDQRTYQIRITIVICDWRIRNWWLHTMNLSWKIVVDNRYMHGLRTPNEAIFHRNTKLLGLGRQFGQINFGAFGVFSANLSSPILVLWVPCPWFPLIDRYFFKKLSLYIQIPKIYVGLGFEFGPQKIRDLAIVSVDICMSVVRHI